MESFQSRTDKIQDFEEMHITSAPSSAAWQRNVPLMSFHCGRSSKAKR